MSPLSLFNDSYMNRSVLSAILLTSLTILSWGKTPGKPSTVNYDEAVAEFKSPSRRHGVDCWWWWLNSNVTREAIKSDLEAMKSKGFYGAMIFDAGGQNQRGNNDVPAGPMFGSKQWTDLFVYALDEAERLGLEIGFNIQSGWNLGGPAVTPEYAAKRIVHSVEKVSGGSECDLTLKTPPTKEGFYKDIAVLAFPVSGEKRCEPVQFLEYKLSIHELGGSAPDCRFLLDNERKEPKKKAGKLAYLVDKDDIVDLTSKMDPDGHLVWRVPEGEWMIMRVGYTCTGAVVSTSSHPWQGLVLDYLSPQAIDWYLATVVDPIFKAAGHHVGTTLTYMETDSWECGGMNWSDNFAQEFKEQNGYDIKPYLPVVGGFVVEDMDKTGAFLADFRKTVGHAVAYNHYKRFADYAHRHNMGIQPESAGPHAGPFDGVRNFSFSDIVMGEFWAPSPHRPAPENRFFMKQASSAAHIFGKKIVAAESFTTIGPHWNDEIWHNQKSSFDHEICAGLNRVYFHTFTCSPKEMGLPGQEYFAGTHVNPRVTWWNEADGFINYMSRVQSLVQESAFEADVLYYYGDHIPVIFPYKHSNVAGTMPGFDFDVTCEEALLRFKVDSDGSIVVPSGLRYKVLVLPDHKVLSLAALEKVEKLLKQGAKVIGPKPERFISLKGGERSQEKFERIADRIWSDDAPEKGSSRYGKGTLVWGMSAREYLLSQGVKEDFSSPEDPGLESLDYIHYRFDGRDLYYVSNITDRPMDVNCVFRVSSREPELWDAMTGDVRTLGAYTQKDGMTTIPLHFDECGSAMIVFNREISPEECGAEKKNYPSYRLLQAVNGPWKVSFDPRWGGPEQVIFKDLVDWTTSSDPAIRYYSGHATYSTSFLFDSDGTKGTILDLGSIKDVGMASVKLNGNDLGVVWTSPFRVDISSAVRRGLNELEVTVVNSWFNRVAGDQLNPEGKQYTSTNIVLDHDFKGRKLDVLKLSPSGLLGPVQILREE